MDLAERRELSQLMEQLADGDRAAFDAVFRSVWPLLRGFCARLLSSAPEAEDAAQETLMKIFSRAHQYRIGADALTWILTIATFECRTYRQRTKRKREEQYEETSFSDLATGSDPESDMISKQLTIAVQETFSKLKDSDRETILASLLDDQRPSIPAATFRKRLQRALERFKGNWETKYDE